MLESIKKVIPYCKTWFERCLTQPDINSRLVFLVQGLAGAVCTIVLVIAFVCSTKHPEQYEYMVFAVGGSSAGSAIGRYFTKKNSNGLQDPPTT